MKKLSSQLISLLVVIVLVSSLLSIVISNVIGKLLFPTLEEADTIMLDAAIKEILMPIIVILLSLIQISLYSKSITGPISDLTRATILIAGGKFDTKIEENSNFKEISTLQTNFNLMARELCNNDILKKDFVTNVSHEFKTPLSVIKGYSDMLCEENLSDEDRIAYANTISREVERLSHLTSNMLRMSRLNNQEILVSPTNFMLDEQIRQVVLMLEKKWSEKNLELNIELDPITYTGDEELLSQVWFNLIDNAIKYTNNNGTITIKAIKKNDNTVIINVIDNGIGMTEKACCKVFEQFYQADKSHSKAGNGLGLAIVQRIVKLHRGNITVKSELGKGSDFRVVLPMLQNNSRK